MAGGGFVIVASSTAGGCFVIVFWLGSVFGSLPARNSHSLVSLAATRAADHRDQETSSQVTQYWFDSPTHPHPISFNLIWILLGCTVPAGSFKQITG